jgi:carbamoyl-phosphate synthase small subunit
VAIPESQAFALKGVAGLTASDPSAGVTSEAAQPSSTPTEGSEATAFKVVAYDCGMKDGILQNLLRAGCDVTVVAWDTPAEDVLAMQPDGVFLSNGPGDPDAVEGTYSQVQKLLGNVPIFGICLGHQMISLAAGAEIEKLKYGHRGGNHPVMNLRTGRVEITAQNHGFGCKFDTFGPLIAEESGGCQNHVDDLRFWVERHIAPVVQNERFGRIQLTHVNLNDGTPEGIAFLDIPAFSVQYHPEASPGPTDSHYLFNAFTRLMAGREDYLDIDIALDRLAGWKFGADLHLPQNQNETTKEGANA